MASLFILKEAMKLLQRKYLCIYFNPYIFMYVYTYIMYVYVYTYIYLCMYIHISEVILSDYFSHIYIYICIYICMNLPSKLFIFVAMVRSWVAFMIVFWTCWWNLIPLSSQKRNCYKTFAKIHCYEQNTKINDDRDGLTGIGGRGL